ncbi:hypothetical protein R9X49_15440 [Pectobacterium carotovorum]|uniref:phage baseplate protein n=1 Tax=Pectobacterium carotovorum TaxID=554 RepID=UPI0029D6F7E7|nr:hypothetical protein [Pectobacterium carotovorum]MDX6916502.1 hypothetical protein [Pectobacterium carotovorum]
MKENTELYGVYDADFNHRFDGITVLKASIIRDAKMMEHPLEDGSTITDHRIILPIEIEIAALIPVAQSNSLYTEIRQAFTSTELFSINTRSGVYPSMAMSAMPHEEDPTNADMIPIVLRFKETILVETQYQALPPRKVKDPKDSSTVNRGEQKAGNKETVLLSGGSAAIDKAKEVFKW